MAQKYSRLFQVSSEVYDEETKPFISQFQAPKFSKKWGIVLLVLATNLVSMSWPYWKLGKEIVPADFAQPEPIETEWKHFYWNTQYSPLNHSESDALWDAILPSHGIVSVDRQWAAERHWPESGYLPSDHSKGVYLLEAYHQIHCLKMLRKTFWEAVDQKPFTHHPGPHLEHCFDALRQSIQCYADSTPLHSFGDKTAGDGQLHKCRNWDQLRDYATKNTACYKDSVQDILLKDHFGFCDDGSDGLPDL